MRAALITFLVAWLAWIIVQSWRDARERQRQMDNGGTEAYRRGVAASRTGGHNPYEPYSLDWIDWEDGRRRGEL